MHCEVCMTPVVCTLPLDDVLCSVHESCGVHRAVELCIVHCS